MEVKHRVSFPGGQQYEQHTAEFTISEKDVSADILKDCNLLEKMFALNVLVLYEGLLFQLCEGYIKREDMEARRKRIFSILSPKLKKIVTELLRNGRGTETS